MTGIVVLAGPPAVGHNTVATLLADLMASPSAPVLVIDGDDLREMVTPAVAPDTGPEWDRQYELCLRNLAAVGLNADRAGMTAILVDVVEPEVLPLLRACLAGASRVDVVLLLADAETLVERDRIRNRDPDAEPAAQARWHDRIRYLRGKLGAAADAYDHVVDNTRQTPEQTAASVRAPLAG